MTNTEKKNNLIILTGPTAVGKTALSLKLANEISKQAAAAKVQMDVLLEINIGNEETKS